MEVYCEPTPELWDARVNGVVVPTRVWRGSTDQGTPVELYVLAIVPLDPARPIDKEMPDFMRKAREAFRVDSQTTELVREYVVHELTAAPIEIENPDLEPGK